jgi:hypothetical protein
MVSLTDPYGRNLDFLDRLPRYIHRSAEFIVTLKNSYHWQIFKGIRQEGLILIVQIKS